MASQPQTYYSNGKLLLTGEYVVLDGALSLALPSAYGQYLRVTPIKIPKIVWRSLDDTDTIWFETILHTEALRKYHDNHDNAETTTIIEAATHQEIAKTLITFLVTAKNLNPSFLNDSDGYEITTKLTFPRNWGLGSSSTLINNIAQWANTDAYQLLWRSFPGSGYDIACAQHQNPVFYQIKTGKPVVKPLPFYPPFADRLYFVYLNKKQNSREGIQQYQNTNKNKAGAIDAVSNITRKIVLTRHLSDFEALITAHEHHISDLLQFPKVKEKLFGDYFGQIKSLGAWGGDFVLATGNEATPAYFNAKGFPTVIPYNNMIIKR